MTKINKLCLVVAVSAFTGCATLYFPDSHGHVVDVHERPWCSDLADEIVIMQVPLVDKGPWSNLARNQSGTMAAFTLDAGGPPDWQVEHVYFEDLRSKERFVILGVPLGYRPFSDLTWVEDRYLTFDRWSQPHYGMHYVVDTEGKRLLLSIPFPDQFYLDSQNPEKAAKSLKATRQTPRLSSDVR